MDIQTYNMVFNEEPDILVQKLKNYTETDRQDLVRGLGKDIITWEDPEEIIEKLRFKGFFNAPASMNHHGNFSGGLFIHSFMVAVMLSRWTHQCKISPWGLKNSPIIVGLGHDLCKCDTYIFEEAPETTGVVPGSYAVMPTEGMWEHNPDQLPLNSHGLASVIYAQQVFGPLTTEEILCIRWHMGSYEKDQWEGYDKAIRMYETVLWTHHADMYVSKVLGV